VRSGNLSERILDKQTAFALIGDAHEEAAFPVIAPLQDGVTAQGDRVVIETEAATNPIGGGAQQVDWRQFVFTLSQCRIATIREYVHPGASHWFKDRAV
jgi:hypothetical protein